MTKKNKESLNDNDTVGNIIKTPEDLLADERVAKYMRKQKLLVRLVQTKLGKLLFGKRLFLHEDILKQQDELFSNLFGDKLDKVDSRYVDAMFLSYSKRKNKGKNPDELCMKRLYDYTGKKLQKNNFDISAMQVNIDDMATDQNNEGVFMSMPEYLNLLENIRLEFKKVNAEYENMAKNSLKNINDGPADIYTSYDADSPADDIRSKKIEICTKKYDMLMKSADIDADFSELCNVFYLALKGSKSLDIIKKILASDMASDIHLDDIFLKDPANISPQQKKITLEHLLMVFEKLLNENSAHLYLRNMYDIS